MQCLFNVISNCAKWSETRTFNCSAITLAKGAPGKLRTQPSKRLASHTIGTRPLSRFTQSLPRHFVRGIASGEMQFVCSPCDLGGWRLGAGRAGTAPSPPHTHSWAPRCTPRRPQALLSSSSSKARKCHCSFLLRPQTTTNCVSKE